MTRETKLQEVKSWIIGTHETKGLLQLWGDLQLILFNCGVDKGGDVCRAHDLARALDLVV